MAGLNTLAVSGALAAAGPSYLNTAGYTSVAGALSLSSTSTTAPVLDVYASVTTYGVNLLNIRSPSGTGPALTAMEGLNVLFQVCERARQY